LAEHIQASNQLGPMRVWMQTTYDIFNCIIQRTLGNKQK